MSHHRKAKKQTDQNGMVLCLTDLGTKVPASLSQFGMMRFYFTRKRTKDNRETCGHISHGHRVTDGGQERMVS